jgi:hypothetical protein
MTSDKLTVSEETARELYNTFKQLEAGDIVSFQAGIPNHQVCKVEPHRKFVWVHFTDPEDNWDPTDVLIDDLVVNLPEESEPMSCVSTFKHHSPVTEDFIRVGKITGVELKDAPDDVPEADKKAVLEWEFVPETANPDIYESDEPEIPDPREDAHPDTRYTLGHLTAEAHSTAVSGGRIETPFFTLVPDNDGTIAIHPLTNQEPVGHIDVSQLEGDLNKQAREFINQEVRDHHLKHPDFPFDDVAE